MALASSHAPLLRELVSFSLQLDEQTEGDADTDATLHRLLAGGSRIANWFPTPSRGRAPHYTHTAWDLRALSAVVPPGLDIELDSRVEDDGSGFARWRTSLHDHIHGDKAAHPSDVEHNSALSYDDGEYGSSWTPNLALARILLAAYLLACAKTSNASFRRRASTSLPRSTWTLLAQRPWPLRSNPSENSWLLLLHPLTTCKLTNQDYVCQTEIMFVKWQIMFVKFR